MEDENLTNLTDMEIFKIYSDIIEPGYYLADCKGAAPVCEKYVNGKCIRYMTCN